MQLLSSPRSDVHAMCVYVITKSSFMASNHKPTCMVGSRPRSRRHRIGTEFSNKSAIGPETSFLHARSTEGPHVHSLSVHLNFMCDKQRLFYIYGYVRMSPCCISAQPPMQLADRNAPTAVGGQTSHSQVVQE